ncbi:MAG: DUF58 domain-containing protein [Actinobacteria bacterium]|nr:DUF58 domain-containing protein [Actinomycetota bacterium]
MAPTTRTAGLLAAAALGALVVPPALAALIALGLLAAAAADAWTVRLPPALDLNRHAALSRGVGATFTCTQRIPALGRSRLRQPLPPGITLTPSEGYDQIVGTIVARRRGRHTLPSLAIQRDGPLRLGSWYHRAGGAEEILVFPDLPAARRLAIAVRRGRFAQQGRIARGPLGLGTDFESIRDYLPDDDIRSVNWSASARLGRPMSNRYRIESDRDIVCVVDCGRLMAAPSGSDSTLHTRLDTAIDAVAAVALVADEAGDRCGALAFDATVRRALRPRRNGGDAVVRALFDLEPAPVDSDYGLAFRSLGEAKRALVIVFTDVIEPVAARPLVDALGPLARKHAVVVAIAADTNLADRAVRPPGSPLDVYRAAAAVTALEERKEVSVRLRSAGAEVVEAPPGALGEASVAAYLKAKARARL